MPEATAKRRFDSLDGLRAFGALAILMVHVGDATELSRRVVHIGSYTFPLNTVVFELDFSVALFFMASGFLVYRPFLAAHVDGRPIPDVLRYLWRRAWRIFPAYWVALTLIVAFTYKSLTYSNGAPSGNLRVAHYLLVWGYEPQWVGGNWGLRQAWTLVVETSFYLFVPMWALLMRAFGRWVGALRAEIIGALLLLPVSPWVVWNLKLVSTPLLLRVLPPFITAFAVGMVFAGIDVWHERRETEHPAYGALARHASWSWLAALIVLLVYSQVSKFNDLTILSVTTRQQGTERLVNFVVAALITLPAAIGLRRSDGVRRVLSWRPLVQIGIVSYGFYLWHYWFIDSLRHQLDSWSAHGEHTRIVNLFAQHIWFEVPAFTVVAVGGAWAMGALSWYLIERPCINLAAGRYRRASRRSISAPIT